MVFTDVQLARLAYEPGWRREHLVVAVAVCLQESGGNPRAHNPRPPDDSYGLWQVNYYARIRTERTQRYGPPEGQYDPRHNARCAFDIYVRAHRRFTDWGAYNTGAYRKYLDRARKAVEQLAWRLPPALAQLRKEADAVAPKRNKASDGSIGDASHSARPSDHNVDWSDPQHDINAIDITHDPRGGWDCNKRVPEVVADPRTQYVIWNHGIYTGVHANGPSPGKRRPYKGSNPHDKHMHVSLKHDERVEEDTSPWLPEFKQEDALAAVTREEFDALMAKVDRLLDVVEETVIVDGKKKRVDGVKLANQKLDTLLDRVK